MTMSRDLKKTIFRSKLNGFCNCHIINQLIHNVVGVLTQIKTDFLRKVFSKRQFSDEVKFKEFKFMMI